MITINNKIMGFISGNVLNETYLGWNPNGEVGFDGSEFAQWEGIERPYTRLCIANWVGIPLTKDMSRITFRHAFYQNAISGVFGLIHEGEFRFFSKKELFLLEIVMFQAVSDKPLPFRFVALEDQPISEGLTWAEELEVKLLKAA
jgi:hypothetical protein